MPIDSSAYRRQIETKAQAVFGESVSYTPKGFAPIVIRAQFRPYYAQTDALGIAIESRRPVLFVHVADLYPHTPGHADRVVLGNSDVYEVIGVEDRDGNAGDAMCSLKLDTA